jgi:hypothetical protein
MNTNPLKQYFRRPEIYLKLPSGGNFYPPGSIDLPENKEIPIYPMTAIDEITSKTPDALFNGTAVVEIIKSCVPNIKDPWSIPSIDLDPILVAIRAASNGNLLEIESTCPSCTEQASYNINLVKLLSRVEVGNYDDPIIINELTFKFKPFTYQKVNNINMIQFEIEQSINKLENIEDPAERQTESGITMQKLNNLSIELISESLEYINTPTAMVSEKEYILDFLRNCDRKTFEQLRVTAVKLRESSQLKPLDVKCLHCSHDYTQKLTLNVSDFFG